MFGNASELPIRQTQAYADWFNRLRDPAARARIDARIRRFSLGNPGDVKSVGGGVSELRIAYGPGYRVYFTIRERVIVILLIGGNKGSQRRDIAKAQKLAVEIERDFPDDSGTT
jgi:putative addiction module killer protein